MNIHDLKIKLEFEKIVNRLRHYTFSELGEARCHEIDFYTIPDQLNQELDKVVQMKEILNSFGDLPLDGLRDIRNSLNKMRIEGHFISPEEFLYILEFLRISRKIKKLFFDIQNAEADKHHLISGLAEKLYHDKILEHNIEITIDENGYVKDNASASLLKIRKQINIHSERLRKTLTNILKKVSEKEYAQEDIVTQRDGRFVIPVKVENKRNVQGIIHSSSASGATVFIEPTEIINLNNEITELHFEEKREVEKILRELTHQVFIHLEKLRINVELLSEMDFLQAKAKYAIESIADKPRISSSNINLSEAYHPILLQTHKRNQVIPLNLSIGEEYNTLVISGPNAGGKTVVLKTLGLLQLMLQSGLLLPAKPESEFRLFKKIFISIGDEQSLENDLSTFSSHLNSIKDILENADDETLILIDEIASGTDPVLGSALSSAILKDLTLKQSITIVTTHNSQLKEFAYNTLHIENASLEFDVDTLSPNFKFVTGIPGQSFTFEIAKKFNFPLSILNEAYNNLDKNESTLEDLLKDLNETKQKYNSLKNKFDIENARLTGLINLYDRKISDFKKNERQLKYAAKIEADKIIKDANKLIERTIKEIKENKMTPKEIKSEFKKQADMIVQEDFRDEPAEVDNNFKVNDFVRIKGSNSAGEIIDISNDIASININGLLIKSKISDLEKTSRKDFTAEHSGESSVKINESAVEFSLDLRGKYSDEIENEIEKFIYNSLNNGLKELSIIHGKGSGKLREEVQKLLKKNSLVKAFRPGKWNEGDSGVTVVEL